MKSMTIALVGNPNSGKTTLFNKPTGSQQKVANWPGVTVEKKQGSFYYGGKNFEVIDLPGVYSLTVAAKAGAVDERIACEYILSQQADLVVNIVDAANLKRNLYLTLQLLEMGVPCIVAVNMLDIARQRRIHLNLKRLSQQLGCPVLPLVANRNEGLETLKETISRGVDQTKATSESHYFPPAIEKAIQQMQLLNLPATIHLNNLQLNHPQQQSKWANSSHLTRWLAIRLLEQDQWVNELIKNEHVKVNVAAQIATAEQQLAEESDIVVADSRFLHIEKIMQESVQQENAQQRTATQRVDSLMMHRWLGIPIFLLMMYLMFELSMNISTLFQPLFSNTATTLFVDGMNYLGHSWGLPTWSIAMLAHGVGLGIVTVVNFIPQIAFMFVGLALLEDSGYMARAAFVMDRLMQAVGLPGKSFVPLIVGFGCNVPAIMATRTLESRRDRILTCMMAPFMSCGARLAIFAVFASAFFPHHSGAIIFLLYLIGVLVALLTGLLLKKTLLKGGADPFVMELPVYHFPSFVNIVMLTWQRLKGFVLRAGKVIVPVCVLVGSLNAIQTDGQIRPEGSEQSILSAIGRSFTPVFEPMGIQQDNWPATVGLITGTLAKEVVIGTLNTLYSQQTQQAQQAASWQQYSLINGLKTAVTATWQGFGNAFSTNMLNPFSANEADHDMSETALGHMALLFGNPWAAFAYLLFVLLYIPYVSTIGVLTREVGRGWAWLATFWSINIAYSLAVIAYQASQWVHQPFQASVWIIALLILQMAYFVGLRWWANNTLQWQLKAEHS